MKLLRIGAPGEEIPAVLGEDGRMFALSELTADIDGLGTQRQTFTTGRS